MECDVIGRLETSSFDRQWMNMGPIRILIADDHAIIRRGLRTLLEHEPGLQVVAEACDGREAIEVAGASGPTSSYWISGCRTSTGLKPAGKSPRCCPNPDRNADRPLGRELSAERAQGRRARIRAEKLG